jgi:hypothetical protein
MKKNALLVLLLLICSSIYSQTNESGSDAADLCNGWIDDTVRPSCYATVGTSPIIGELFDDDSEDIFLFPNGFSGTVTFSNFPTAAGSSVKIKEYTGTAGTMGATTGMSITISTSSPTFTFSVSKKYYLSIEKDGSTVNYSIVFSSPLPVQLVSFSGNRVSEGIELIWKTSQEKNSKSFEIERSRDALDYKSIGEINAIGNSNVGKTYQFLDSNPLEGINYYRLKQNDFDKKFSYLRPISVIFAYEERDLVLYPNPSSQTIRLPLSFVQGADILKIYHPNGTLVKQFLANENNLIISIEDLSIGSYLIVSPSNNSISGNRVKRFVKE